jgi:hypothetical protein
MENAEMRINELSFLSDANGFTLWHYKLEDDEDVLEAGFWNPSKDMLRAGDMIMVSGGTARVRGVIVLVSLVKDGWVEVKEV